MTNLDPAPPPGNGVHESWSIKEVFADLKTDFSAHLDKQDATLDKQYVALNVIDTKLDSKADRSEVLAMATEFRTGHQDHGRRITVLEQHRSDDLAGRRTRNRIWAAVGSGTGIVAIIVGSLISRGGHW
jgi:hypothetical protein